MTMNLRKIMSALKSKSRQKIKSSKTRSEDAAKIGSHDYFRLARHWSDDFYAAMLTSRNRWRALSLYALVPLSVILLFCVVTLIPLQHLEPLLIHHYEDGQVVVMPFKQGAAPLSRAQIDSELVRYVINRESYSAASYQEQYALINLLSDSGVAEQYRQDQSASNKNSPINRLGNTGYQSVHIESVVFLDNKGRNKRGDTRHHNLAQVNFTLTDVDKTTGTTVHVPLTVLISWEHRGTPRHPNEAWRNWNGFTVTHYRVDQRNI